MDDKVSIAARTVFHGLMVVQSTREELPVGIISRISSLHQHDLTIQSTFINPNKKHLQNILSSPTWSYNTKYIHGSQQEASWYIFLRNMTILQNINPSRIHLQNIISNGAWPSYKTLILAGFTFRKFFLTQYLLHDHYTKH